VDLVLLKIKKMSTEFGFAVKHRYRQKSIFIHYLHGCRLGRNKISNPSLLSYKTTRRLLMKTKGILSFFVLFTLAVILAMPGQGEAFDDKFVGTYFAAGETGVIGEDSVDCSLIVTINKDGNCSVIYSIQGTTLFGDAFTDEQGVCRPTGPGELTCRMLAFDYLPPCKARPDGEVLANTVDNFVIQFDSGFQEISITASGTGYPPDVNPLDPGGATPVFEFAGSFGGERVTVP
jgi:hypothetical protein